MTHNGSGPCGDPSRYRCELHSQVLGLEKSTLQKSEEITRKDKTIQISHYAGEETNHLLR